MLLEARDIRVSFRKENQTRLVGRERATILHGVSLELEKGECLGIIGESGSGKSTLGRVLCGLLRPDSGKVLLNGTPLYGRHTPEELARIRNRISIVFQDYTTSVNPRFRVSTILHESFRALRRAGRTIPAEEEYRTAYALLERVGLRADFMHRYPHELSGGQLQRVCIARAVAIEPEVILLDEAVSSLDAATQVQVMEMLRDLGRDIGLSYLFITHDLMAITYFCSRVRFMHNGRFVEAVDDMSRIGEISNGYARDLLHAVAGIGTVRRASDSERIAAELAADRDVEAGAACGAGRAHVERVAF